MKLINVSTKSLSRTSLWTNLSLALDRTILLLAALGSLVLISGCGGGNTSVVDDNNNSLSSNISIGTVATIPVLDGHTTQAGIYIRNTTGQSITGITYALAKNTNQTSLILDLSKCTSISANSSCLLPVTTPKLDIGASGSNILVASYNGHQSKQLINYRYMSVNDYTGVNFSDGSANLYGTNDYATIYAFVGKGLSQIDVGFNLSNTSLAISSGLTNGKTDLPANMLVPLEIHSNQDVISNLVTLTPYTVTTSSQFVSSLQTAGITNQILQVSITPMQQANLLMSDVTTFTQAESTKTLTIFNNGNQPATGIALNSIDSSKVSITTASINPCANNATLPVGASCNKLNLINNSSSGNTGLTLDYFNGILQARATQTVYFQNSKNEPMVSVVATQSSFTEQVNTNQNITFNIHNTGDAPLNNVLIAPKKTFAGVTLTTQNSTCSSTIAANSGCLVQINVSASNSIASGIIYLNVGGNYTGTGAKNYSFMSKGIAATITDSINPTVTSTTPQDTVSGVSTATSITLNFSEPMNPTTLNSSNIKLQKVSDNSVVAIALQGVTNNNQTATFVLSGSNLTSATQYKIVVNPSQIKDSNGNAMNSSLTTSTVATFTTIVADTTAPVISNFAPANGLPNQSKTPTISISFSEAMNPSTLTPSNIILKTQAGVSVSGYTISYNASTFTATLNLATPLADTTTYQLLVIPPNIKDVAGNSLGVLPVPVLVTSFTTGDFTAPTLSSTVPVNGINNVAVASSISLTFSEAMNITTLVTPNILLQKSSDNSNVTLGAPSYSNSNKTVTFQPTTNLVNGTQYNIVINPSQIKDTSGNAMNSSVTVSNVTTFTVGNSIAPTVTNISPADNSVDVQLNPLISVTFSVAVSNVNSNNVELHQGSASGNLVSIGGITSSGNIYSFSAQGSLAYDTSYFIIIKDGITGANGVPLVPFISKFATLMQPGKIIFVTNGSWNGDLKTAGNAANGTIGADNLCNSDSAKPMTSPSYTYKAMILSQERSGSPLVDWVLTPNTIYYNLSGKVIGTTNSNSVFNFPVTNSINNLSTTYYVWSGSWNSPWTLDSDGPAYYCNNWTSSSVSLIGDKGYANSITKKMMSAEIDDYKCDKLSYLYCVQQ